jgi:putative protease
MSQQVVPQLLSPAGSLDAVRAALANGADAIYLGASRFNARDEGAQLSLDELEQACQMAHARGRRIYLTLNVLVKPGELADALLFLGEGLDRGIDAVIVQDLGLVRLIRRLYPALEIHGSTQMTVHDASGAAVLAELGVERVVLARENTLDDIRAIREAVPELGLETFIHGALCISYSGQCYMSGMISERSANRGSCAQSCRKDYVLADVDGGRELDRGYLISTRDLAAHDHLAALAQLGVGCLKIEGRKKRPEYVATVTNAYRTWLDRLERGEAGPIPEQEIQPLVQIYSRGFTGGMYGGRAGREYVTRTQPDNRGIPVGTVVGYERGELLVDASIPLHPGDGVGFEAPDHVGGPAIGLSITAVRAIPARRAGLVRQAIATRTRVPMGWRVIRTSEASLLERARASYAALPAEVRGRKTRLDVRVFGSAGSPLKAVFSADGETVTVRSEIELVPASRRALDPALLREQLGRLGETPFVLATIDDAALPPGLFLPVSELNHLRQRAIDQFMTARDWAQEVRREEHRSRVVAAVNAVSPGPGERAAQQGTFTLCAQVYTVDDARAAADAGATEVCIDPFLRHPTPSPVRVERLRDELATRGVTLRVRTPTIVRPEERRGLDRWLALGTPLLTGHLGLVRELADAGRDVVADYAVNVFNQHAAVELFRLGARRIVLSVELTAGEMREVVAPWSGRGFDVFLYGRPEGMTIEHCVLSAAFDRVPTTCRDLCVKHHPNVQITDPAGYAFPVATDHACRNRLLHSRPVEGSEFVPQLWSTGIRNFQIVFNVPGEPVSEIVARYRTLLESATGIGTGEGTSDVRALLGGEFTRGHFARAV